MDVLRAFALGTDPRHVAVTLHVVEEPRRTGDPARVIEVRLDGERVGVMSKAISEQIQDLVTYVSSRVNSRGKSRPQGVRLASRCLRGTQPAPAKYHRSG